jgi:hypothetical protein
MATLRIGVESAALRALIDEIDKLPKSLQKAVLHGTAVGKEFDNMGKKGQGSFDALGLTVDKITKKIMSTVSVIGMVTAATALARKEWEDYEARIKAAAATQISVDQARATAMLQLPTDMRPEEADKLVSKVSSETGLSQKDVWSAAGEAFSAKGALSKSALMEAMITSGRITKATGGAVSLGTMAGSVMDLQSATGVSGKGSGGQMLGWIQQFGSASRITDLRRQADALAPTVKAGQEMGVTPERSAELLAAATQIGADPLGEKSRSGVINFFQKIKEMKGLKGTGFEERLASAQTKVAGMNERQQTEFYKDFGGEAQMQGFIRGIIGQSPAAMAQLANARASIGAPTDPGLAKLGTGFMATVENSPTNMPAAARGAMSKLAESAQLADTRGLKGEISGGLDETLSAMGVPWARRKAAGIAFAARTAIGENPADAAKGIAGAAVGRSDFDDRQRLMPALDEFFTKMDRVAAKFLEAAAEADARKKNPKLFAQDAGLNL